MLFSPYYAKNYASIIDTGLIIILLWPFEVENFHGFLPLESLILLCTVHNGMGLMYRKSFPVKCVLCTTAKFCRTRYTKLLKLSGNNTQPKVCIYNISLQIECWHTILGP